MEIGKKSQFTGVFHTREIDVDPFEYEEWKLGYRGHVQSAFPHLSVDDREFLLTGITPEEWNEIMPPEDEEEDFEAWIEDEEADYTDYPSDYESDLWDGVNDGARYDADGFRF